MWTAAEMAVTLVCIGIPASRSLCKYFRARLVSEYSNDYRKTAEYVYGLRTIGGGSRAQRRSRPISANVNVRVNTTANDSWVVESDERPIAIASPDGKPQRSFYTQSDEEILLESPRAGGRVGAPLSTLPAPDRGIRITEEIRVTRS